MKAKRRGEIDPGTIQDTQCVLCYVVVTFTLDTMCVCVCVQSVHKVCER